jgi:hypothetical protein
VAVASLAGFLVGRQEGAPGFFGSKAAVTSTPRSGGGLRACLGKTKADRARVERPPLPCAARTFDLDGPHLSPKIDPIRMTAPRVDFAPALAGDQGSRRAYDSKPPKALPSRRCRFGSRIVWSRQDCKIQDRCIDLWPISVFGPISATSCAWRRMRASCSGLSAFIRTCNANFSGGFGYRSCAALGGLPCARQCQSWRRAWPSTSPRPFSVDTRCVCQSGARSPPKVAETRVPMW